MAGDPCFDVHVLIGYELKRRFHVSSLLLECYDVKKVSLTRKQLDLTGLGYIFRRYFKYISSIRPLMCPIFCYVIAETLIDKFTPFNF